MSAFTFSPKVCASNSTFSLSRPRITTSQPALSKCFVAKTAISPAPTTTAVIPAIVSPKTLCACATATEAIEIGFFEILVTFLTSAAHFTAYEIIRFNLLPAVSLQCESINASFTCPVICDSPMTSESKEETTENICFIASSSS